MKLRSHKTSVGLILCLLLLVAVAAAAQGTFSREPAWFTSVSHYPNRPRSYTVPVEVGQYHSILVSGLMLGAVEHRGTYFRATRCDACYCWETGDRPRPRNNDPTNARPWTSAPRLVFGMVSNNLGLEMCQQTPYNEQHQYWSGWFLAASPVPLVISHNVAAHPRNSTSFTFYVGRPPRDVNPIGSWEFRDNAWVDSRGPLGAEPGYAGSDSASAPSRNLFSPDHGRSPAEATGSGSITMGFDEYLESTSQRWAETGLPQGEATRPNQGGKSREQCIREICPVCAQSVGLLGQYADPRCQTCVDTESARIQACMASGRSTGEAPVAATDRCGLIPGTWRWFTGATIRADGRLFRSSSGNVGDWTCQDPTGVVEIRWRNGGWIDTLRLSPDGRRLDGANQHGNRVSGTR